MEQNSLTHPARLYNIEFLRILFTFCIFVFHARNAIGLPNKGYYGVEFFFVLSGFFLTYTIDRQKNLSAFIFKKVIRFLPLMLFGEIVCQVITHQFFMKNYISLIFFLPSTGLSAPGDSLLLVNWYINVLMWVSVFYFYIIKTQTKSTANLIIGLVTFLSCVGFNLSAYFFADLEGHLFPKSMFRGVFCMGCGYFLESIYQSDVFKKSTVKKYAVFSILEFWCIGYLLGIIFIPFEFQADYVHVVILFLILIFLFLLKRGWMSQFFDDDSWGRISKYCLSFFLTHLIVVDCLYYRLGFFENLSKGVSFMIMLFLCIGLSVFAYHVIEKPSYHYLKRFLEDKPQKTLAKE